MDNKKEVKPNQTQSIKYHDANKTNILEEIRKATPKELIPTRKTSYVFGAIFLIVIVYAIIAFPFGRMLSGNVEDLQIKVGLPLAFLIFDLTNPEITPFRIGALVADIFIYLILSYAIDIAINLFLSSPFIESKEEKRKRPQLFENIKTNNPPEKNKITLLKNQKTSEKTPTVEELRPKKGI